MPKILECGVDNRRVVGIYNCTGEGNGNAGCRAKLEVYQDDLYRTFSSHYDGSTDFYVTFACPQCRAETDINYQGNTRILPSKSKHPLYLAKNRVNKSLQNLCGDNLERWIQINEFILSQKTDIFY